MNSEKISVCKRSHVSGYVTSKMRVTAGESAHTPKAASMAEPEAACSLIQAAAITSTKYYDFPF